MRKLLVVLGRNYLICGRKWVQFCVFKGQNLLLDESPTKCKY
ncbi:MAG: hypothetical protein R6V12_03025 [Candidatus Hydrogenedentota bacterium]